MAECNFYVWPSKTVFQLSNNKTDGFITFAVNGPAVAEASAATMERIEDFCICVCDAQCIL